MEFTGIIQRILPIQSGTSQSGNEWKKQDFVFEYFETPDQRWSDKVVLSIMNDRINEFDLKVNDKVRIGFGHRIREYNGRLYNEVQIYKMEKLTDSQSERVSDKEQKPTSSQAELSTGIEKTDDLPF